MATNRQSSSLVHEFCHKIGSVGGTPSGFEGLPDRGDDTPRGDGHDNLTTCYDVMYHNDNFPALHSLYGLIPLTSYDRIFFDWIKDDEIKVINNGVSLNDIYLSPITEEQVDQGTYKVIKVMISEDYEMGSEWDEYFLIEYHNGTNFDKQYHNYDEGTFNEGVLIWHIKEQKDMINILEDNLLDIELAVPYNGWNSNPVPDDGYPGTDNYDRSAVGDWNGNHAQDFDWLDDIQITNSQFNFMPDGGRNIWSTTVTNDPSNDFSWDASGERWMYRINSLKSDFFTDQPIKGIVTNSMTNFTRPSTKDWAGNATNIEILNIQKVNNYMTVDIVNPSSIRVLPFHHTYSNIGHTNNYDVQGSDGADVSYFLVLDEAKILNLTLCGAETDYDTKLEIFNEDGSSTGYYNDDEYDCTYNSQYSSMNDIGLDAGNYYVVVDGCYGLEGNYELNIEEVGGGVQNWDFNIDELPYSDTYNNINAGDEWDVMEVDGADIAYKLVLDNAATIDVTLCSSNTDYDTKLEIFYANGTTTGYFSDDDCDINYKYSSLNGKSLLAGTYFIVVDGYDGKEGNYELHVDYTPTNLILGLPYSHISSTTNEMDNWNVEGGDGADVEYKLVLNNATTIDVTLCSSGTDYDTKLEIFNADGTTTGYFNDDDCDINYIYSSLNPVSLPTGTYYIVVDGYDGLTGNYEISITEVFSKSVAVVPNSKSSNLLVEPSQITMAFDYEANKSGKKLTTNSSTSFESKGANQADAYIADMEKDLNGGKPLPDKYFVVSPPVDRKKVAEYEEEKKKKTGGNNELILNPAYPTPGNPSATISYYLPENTNVSISIYNSLGKLVKTLVNAEQKMGEHSLLWNGKNKNGSQVASGIYFVNFSALNKNLSQKIILLK